MNRLLLIGPGLWLGLLSACGPATDSPPGAAARTPAGRDSVEALHPNRAAILRDYMSWYTYHYRQIHLARDFAGLDTAARPIARHDFLTRLASGRYVAFHTLTRQGKPYYQLYAPAVSNPDIKHSIRQLTDIELQHERQRGQRLPAYSFTDLQGRQYTPQSTKGKLLVLKCWFIGCTACVQEFPALNRLVMRYRNQPDVLFVSLAFDRPQALTTFLKTRAFQYAVVPLQREYMQQQLGVDSYPTHILVDRTGRIAQVTNTIEDLEPMLAKLATAQQQ